MCGNRIDSHFTVHVKKKIRTNKPTPKNPKPIKLAGG